MGFLEKRIERKAFPHLCSAWWIAILFVLMCVPGVWSELWMRAHPDRKQELMGFAMFWGLVIIPFFLVLILTSLVMQVIKIAKLVTEKSRRPPFG